MGPNCFDRFFVAALYLLIQSNLIKIGCSKNSLSDIKITVPSSHTTLSGDVDVEIQSSSTAPLSVQLFRLEGNSVQSLANFSVFPEALRQNNTKLIIPCGYFSRGGKYYVLARKKNFDDFYGDLADNENGETSMVTETIDVKWSMPDLKVVPDHIQTYPRSPVIVTLDFPTESCPPASESLGTTLPEFWFELYFCGHSPTFCDSSGRRNQSYQILHTEQVRSFPGEQNITLGCENFGLAGYYAVFIRTTTVDTWTSHKSVYLKADWSEEFVFNVHAQSIFPCDRHDGGITVLFQYPACIITGDRVRLFARHRAEVAALVPPTTLEYVAEQKVVRGSNKLKFDCDLFSEHFIEYCFVYVSQAITGAVADVRIDCVPTLPVRETKNGGWGPWSPWTTCSSTCLGGTRSRFRLCDSPLPRFGGKFCKGESVQTEKCGTDIENVWECFDGSFDQFDHRVAEIPNVKDEVGLYCRCGCVVHLGRANPKRILATSSQSCPGRIFWQIQADVHCIIQFKIEWFESSCGIQWLKIRDGMTLSSLLLAHFSDLTETRSTIINSTGSTMLLEFFSEEMMTNGQTCGGGFLAYARQLERQKVSPFIIHRPHSISPFVILKLTAVHSTAIFFLSGVLIAMALLGAQYTFRYRKYQIAYTDDNDSAVDISASCATLISRRSSNSTLFSEVLSLHPLVKPTKTETKNSDHKMVVHENPKECTESRKEEDAQKEVEKIANAPQKESVASVNSKDQDIEEEYRNDLSETSKDDSTESNKTDSSPNQGSDDVNVLTPAKGEYSSSRRKINTATIRNTNPKEAKERKNREKLLAGPSGSDFSISGNGIDLEVDYYDYNVSNAGAAPGSYLGMDPAFLVYIPPLYGSGDLSIDEEDNRKLEEGDRKSDEDETENISVDTQKTLESYNKCIDNNRKKSPYKLMPSDESITPILEKPVVYESKVARLHLQGLPSEDLKKSKTKIEEIQMIDSNILDEIKFADEDDDEKH
ncbi:uncharacterized protein LOC123315099 [Coccinella septempunctata]|uniref:uncharacterized protein LOC123315099 n=1 Tax=Coccinella septempunctata TaxID=41139 RepID=UPI001D086EC9|nr:uncharacterized protein LOC123315099 [Coccinella septempunctata]